MVRVRLEVRMPVEEVFDYFSDFRNENEWNVVAHDVEMLTPPPVGSGSRFAGQYDRMGRLEYEILEYERPHRFRVRGEAKAFRFLSTFTFSHTAEGTRVDATMDPHGKGGMAVLTPLMGGIIKKQMSKGLESLRQTLERKATAS